MTIPDTVYKTHDFAKCHACGWDATLYAETDNENRGICSSCWFRDETDVVDVVDKTGNST